MDKVEVESGAFALQHPAIDSNTFSTVSRALFSSRNSKWSIASAPKRIRKPRRLSTLGLVEVGGVIYLVAAMVGYPKPAMYRLDRVISATMLPEIFTYPRNSAWPSM